jgi:DNA-binding MarR family transcriptional regulator
VPGTRPGDGPRLGAQLRRAWVGYQRELDAAMAAAGFADRRLPDGRVLRMGRRDSNLTIAGIGRELGISRQGAAKIVHSLRDRGFVTLHDSTTSGREKVVRITPRAEEYLATQRRVARAIERRLQTRLGADAFAALDAIVDALGAGANVRLRDHLRQAGVREL